MNQNERFYDFVDQETVEIYQRFPLIGFVLDVGGGMGTTAYQAGIPADSYISVDPLVSLWSCLPAEGGFVKHYKSIENHRRVPGYAEDLPIWNSCVDTVHMRSCLDHFSNPHRALLEARRVLKRDGQLIIGLSLEGAYKINAYGIKNKLKSVVKRSFLGDFYGHFFDPHIFHPTSNSLRKLVEIAGFLITDWYLQPGYHNVVYIRAVPKDS